MISERFNTSYPEQVVIVEWILFVVVQSFKIRNRNYVTSDHVFGLEETVILYDNNKKFNECIINVFRNTINPGYVGMHYNQTDNKNKILLLLIL